MPHLVFYILFPPFTPPETQGPHLFTAPSVPGTGNTCLLSNGNPQFKTAPSSIDSYPWAMWVSGGTPDYKTVPGSNPAHPEITAW
jgi:hypothetical protein